MRPRNDVLVALLSILLAVAQPATAEDADSPTASPAPASHHIGSVTIKKIWTSFNPYKYANSISELNLSDWYNKSIKFEKAETSPELTSQKIVIPKKHNIVEPDFIKIKRKKKNGGRCGMK